MANQDEVVGTVFADGEAARLRLNSKQCLRSSYDLTLIRSRGLSTLPIDIVQIGLASYDDCIGDSRVDLQ